MIEDIPEHQTVPVILLTTTTMRPFLHYKSNIFLYYKSYIPQNALVAVHTNMSLASS